MAFIARRRRLVATAAATALLLATASFGAVSGTTAIDLRDQYDVKIVGAGRVAAAGDVNGDGVPDVLVSRGDTIEQPTRGRTWVVFGRSEEETIRLDDLGDRGFVIEGADENDRASHAAGIGDVNGDGLDDVAVGAPEATNGDGVLSGVTYVVFGKTDTNTVDLLEFDLGIQMQKGFRIDGPHYRAYAGEDVAGVGDVTGDGLPDLAVGAPFAGATYVVAGKAGTDPVQLSAFDRGNQEAGFRIATASPSYNDGYSVGGGGDVNGDSIPDIVVGVIPTDRSTGSAFVVFGKTSRSEVDTLELGRHGFRIKGVYSGSSAGYAVADAGDVNGDGRDDVIVGAPATTSCCGPGDAFVVFGKRGPGKVRLGSLRRHGAGFRIAGRFTSNTFDHAGWSVDGAPDVNADGLADVMLGALFASHRKRPGAGSVYMVFGKRGSRTVKLSELDRWRGYRMDGANRGDEAGTFVAGVDDMNGDGIPEVVVGAPGAGEKTREETATGNAYIVWGRRL